jgi:hypothetical protein
MYYIFSGDAFYPSGGVRDYISKTVDKGKAISEAKLLLSGDSVGSDWVHVVDEDMRVIYEGGEVRF